jgi:hypothetical protein
MSEHLRRLHPEKQLSEQSFYLWRAIQAAVWLVGAGIMICLVFFPNIGLLLFWNILIPIAPALFVLATGVWRNICPLATTNLMPRHFGLSERKKLTAVQLGKLNLLAIMMLYTIVPLRHAVFNNSGIATASLIMAMVVLGMIMGFYFEWKSAWCSGLCPVHPVEKLYGGNTLFTVQNAHCTECQNCVVPCPDSTPNIHPISTKRTLYHQLSGLLIVGGLPGFIWGWFHVPDEQLFNWNNILGVYKLPLLGFIITSIVYIIASMMVSPKFEQKLVSVFAAAGVSCYYFYRLPALIGFGDFHTDGLLINLSNSLPVWIVPALQIATTVFFFYWMVIRKQQQHSWVIRPPFAGK